MTVRVANKHYGTFKYKLEHNRDKTLYAPLPQVGRFSIIETVIFQYLSIKKMSIHQNTF